MNPFHKTTIGKPKKWLIEAASDIGLDYSELSHMENLQRIVNMNGKSDLSRAKKIIAAGGYPGGEA